MFYVGTRERRTCRGVTRRELLQVGGAAALGLSSAFALPAGAEPSPADSCILIWLEGGPSHHETFDPKPEAPSEIRGPYPALETTVSGFQVSSLIPLLARQARRYSVIRSVTHDNPNHEPLPMLSGDPKVESTYGAVYTWARGLFGTVPPYVNLGYPLRLGPGPLGSVYAPVQISNPSAGADQPDFRLSPRLAGARFERRRELRGRLGGLRDREHPLLAAQDLGFERAIDLLTQPAVRSAFDLEREPLALRERYGAGLFGQSCLLARRLVEAGTRFVQVRWSENGGVSWDTHGTALPGLLEMEQYLCPRFDQGLAALIADLHDRGMLERTLVLAFGEFGRTPKISLTGGRDHWPNCFSALLAGGGIPGGTVVGASDAQGAYPASRPVSPQDLAATIYAQLGLDPNRDDRLRTVIRGERIL
jgi:hypothetical protein